MAEPSISFAQNGEDVVLWRALGGIRNGSYLDVGANDPVVSSVTKRFYDAGWRGLAVEPNPEYASRFRVERPEDVVLEAVITDTASESVPFHLIEGTGLSTLVDDISETHRAAGFEVREITVPSITLDQAIVDAGLDGRDIHFMVVDTEGAEAVVLDSIDLGRHRPWVLVIEATEPRSSVQSHEGWEQRVLESGYRFCLFDGLSRFYVAEEHAAELEAALSYPAGVLDDFVRADDGERVDLLSRLAQSERDIAALRAEADGAHAAVRVVRR